MLYRLLWAATLLLLPIAGICAASSTPVSGVELIEFPEARDDRISKEQAIEIAFERLESHDYAMTFEQMQGVADALTSYLRKGGLRFSSAFLPEQSMSDQTLSIRFSSGYLGDIHVVNPPSDAARQTIENAFDELRGQVVYQPEIDRRVKALNRDPRISVFAFYSRGRKKQEARLNVKVERFERWQGRLLVDNYGSETTGRNRALVRGSLLSPFHRRDRLSIGGLVSRGDQSDESTTLGFLSYRLPLNGYGDAVDVFFGNSLFNVGGSFSDLNLEGDSQTAQMTYTNGVSRSASATHELSTALFYTVTDFASDLDSPLVEPDEEAAGTRLGWNWNQRFAPIAVQLEPELTGGEFERDGSGQGSQSFWHTDLVLGVQAAVFRASNWHGSARLKLRGRYTNGTLPASEREAFSGPGGIRSISPGFFATDRHALARLTLDSQFNGGGGGFLRPLVFIESAYGEQVENSDASVRVDALSYGAGLEFGLGQSLRGRVLAPALLDIGNDDLAAPEEQDVLAELQLIF